MSAPFPKNMGVLSGFVYAEGNHVSPLGSFPVFQKPSDDGPDWAAAAKIYRAET